MLKRHKNNYLDYVLQYVPRIINIAYESSEILLLFCEDASENWKG